MLHYLTEWGIIHSVSKKHDAMKQVRLHGNFQRQLEAVRRHRRKSGYHVPTLTALANECIGIGIKQVIGYWWKV